MNLLDSLHSYTFSDRRFTMYANRSLLTCVIPLLSIELRDEQTNDESKKRHGCSSECYFLAYKICGEDAACKQE